MILKAKAAKAIIVAADVRGKTDSPHGLPETHPPAKLNALTSLRFFAAFAIVVEHSRGLLLPPDILTDWPLDQGVSFFFVLSGFILVYVYPEIQTSDLVLRFWTARCPDMASPPIFTLAGNCMDGT
jgi:hypothetical protein